MTLCGDAVLKLFRCLQMKLDGGALPEISRWKRDRGATVLLHALWPCAVEYTRNTAERKCVFIIVIIKDTQIKEGVAIDKTAGKTA